MTSERSSQRLTLLDSSRSAVHRQEVAPTRQWECIRRGGPVLATAVHNGHTIRADLEPYLFASEDVLRRDEDPLTGVLASIGDDVFRAHTSRFEVDLNRSREKAFSVDPRDTWGVRIYRERPPEHLVEEVLADHDRFYRMMGSWIESLIATHDFILLLDIHSYNHRRTPDGQAGPQDSNPDIDLGVTTLDAERFGSVAERFEKVLSRHQVSGRPLDVRRNVRYPDGGFFPEWVFRHYGRSVCTITVEVKKIYMNEQTGQLSLAAVCELTRALRHAKQEAAFEIEAGR